MSCTRIILKLSHPLCTGKWTSVPLVPGAEKAGAAGQERGLNGALSAPFRRFSSLCFSPGHQLVFREHMEHSFHCCVKIVFC